MLRCLPCLLLGIALPADARAQTIQGRVLEESGALPIADAFVSAHDSTGTRLAGAISNAEGLYRFDLARPGRIRLRVDRLGYATYSTEAFEAPAGVTITRNIRIVSQPVALPVIEADAAPRCEGNRTLAAAAATLWQEARKALTLVSWTAEHEPIRYEVERRIRFTSAQGRMTSYSADTMSLTEARSPFWSPPADSLLGHGFVINSKSNGAWVYFGPDANVLLSDEFLDAYCLHAISERGGERVGLRFQPAADTPPGIEGTVWLDARSFALQQVEFDFVNLPYEVRGVRQIGGVIDFRRIAGGGWIVASWSMRTPRLRTVNDRRILIGYAESEHEVIAAYDAAGTALPLRGR